MHEAIVLRKPIKQVIKINKETIMKRNTKVLLIAAVFALLMGLVGFAYSEGNTAPASNGSASCQKFTDSNKDGICDSAAVHLKDGKCMNNAQCKKDGKCQGSCTNCTKNKDGKCDMTKCGNHAADATQSKASGSACPSMSNGKCSKTGKVCPGH
jgi:hypothetical protein